MLDMLNKKRIITVAAFVILLSVLCVSFFSCSKNNVPHGEYNITIKLDDAEVLSKITLRVKHTETGEVYDLDFLRKENYTKNYMLDFGIYKIVEVDPHHKDYEIEITSNVDTALENNLIKNGTFAVAEDAEFVLNVKEIDTSGTLQWYIKNNAFTVCILLACIIALMIVRAKKKTKIVPVNEQKMQ